MQKKSIDRLKFRIKKLEWMVHRQWALSHALVEQLASLGVTPYMIPRTPHLKCPLKKLDMKARSALRSKIKYNIVVKTLESISRKFSDGSRRLLRRRTKSDSTRRSSQGRRIRNLHRPDARISEAFSWRGFDGNSHGVSLAAPQPGS